jgi:DNA-binding GntR family transcriptional regulator
MHENKKDIAPVKGCKKGKTTQDAFERIKHLISVNQLAPGQKLIYGDIAKMLNIGVTPVIQALNQLKVSGLVRYEANKGYTVGEISEAEARQLYQAREALEIYIVPDIIKNIGSANVDDIAKRFSRNEGVRPSRRELILEDMKFHMSIVRYAHNEVIYFLLQGILEQVYLKYRPEYLSDRRVMKIMKEHHDLLEGIKKGDVEETIAILKHHIRSGADYMIESIKSEKSWFTTIND